MRAGLAGAVLMAAAVLLGAGCSSGGSSAASSPTPSSSSAACTDVAAVRAAVAQVGHLSASGNALDKLKTDVIRIRADVARLRADAGTEWKPQIDALNSALVKLQMTLKNLNHQSNPAAAAAAVSTDLAGVTSAASTLLHQAGTRCPSASASPSA